MTELDKTCNINLEMKKFILGKQTAVSEDKKYLYGKLQSKRLDEDFALYYKMKINIIDTYLSLLIIL